MKLDDVVHGNESLLYMERYVDEGARTYSPFAARSDVAPQFRPQTGRPSFNLATVRVPKERLCVLEGDCDPVLRSFYVRADDALFAIHPETWASSEIEHIEELHALPRG